MIPGEAQAADVVIIGAGPAGLAVGAVLRHAGLNPLILEQADRVGVRWHTHYERLHLHTAKQHSALPYMPFPANYPTYPSRLQFIDYLNAYAKQFQLRILFNQRVTAAEYRDRLWETTTQDSVFHSRSLVVATGYNEKPYLPMWLGQETFGGQILHSADYKNGEPFRSQDVLVIGFGNSGGEIAIDLWERGARPAIAVRSPVNVVFRDWFGIPAQRLSILLSVLPPRIGDLLTAPARLRAYGDLTRYGLRKQPFGPVTQIKETSRIPVIDVGTIKLIREGHIKVYPDVKAFTPDGVTFSDGTTKHFDAVILATGYRVQVGMIFKDAAALTNREGIPITSGQESALPRLYFIGFRNSATGLLREIGIEAKRIAAAITRTRQAAP